MSIQVLSAQEFRQKLAGFVDPDRKLPEFDRDYLKDAAVRFCSILAALFGESLDRKTLWERIGNGLVVCSAKCGGDWEAFVNQMLQYIKADGARVAASRPFDAFIGEMNARPDDLRRAWLRVMETKHFLIIVKARALWNSQKVKPKEAEIVEEPSADGFVDDVPGKEAEL